MIELKRPFFISDTTPKFTPNKEIKILRGLGIELCIPLLRLNAENETVLAGLICLGKRLIEQPYSKRELSFIGLLGEVIAISLHNTQMYFDSIIDSLTGIYSRGHFDLHLVSELHRARRYAH